MNTTFNVTTMCQTLALCAGFGIAGISGASQFPASPAVSPIQSASTANDVHAELPAGWYEYLHDASIHQPDDLGNYADNYRLDESVDPQSEPLSTIDRVQVGLPSGLYEYFHDAEVHKPDGLGNYSENYRLTVAVESQNKPTPTVDEVQVELPPGWYEYLHDAELHKPDGLGNYAQNFQTAYPN